MLIALAVLFIAIAGYFFYGYATANNDYFRRRNIPFLRPTFLLGNTGGFFLKKQRINEFLDQMYSAMPTNKIFGFFMFRTPLLFATDPQIIKQICVKDFDHFVDHRSMIETNPDDMFALTLPALAGEKWRQMRATLSPAFTGSKMRSMFELVTDCGSRMCRALGSKSAADLESLDMKLMFRRYANDVIATTAFGISVDSFVDEDNDFIRNGQRMMEGGGKLQTAKFIMMTMFPWLTKRLGWQMFDAKVIDFFKGIVMETIETRQREKIYRPDVVNLLMQLRRDGDLSVAEESVSEAEKATDGFATADDSVPSSRLNGKEQRSWTENEIVAQCFLFFAAGFDSVSNTLSTLAYELAINPDAQQRLYEECAGVRDELREKGIEKLPYDVLQNMEYLDGVVTESLRLWPAAMFTERMCTKDYAYDDGELRLTVEANTSVWIPLRALHMDEKYFENPKHFDPDRFGAERRSAIVPGTYMPFGVGPRNCIASRFALMEMKAAVYHLILQFQFVPCEKTQIPLQFAKSAGTFVFEKGIHLSLIKRQ